jgi:predicted CoA-binding protein
MENAEQRTVMVIGASRSREKFGNKALRAYVSQGYRVIPVNPLAEEIEGLKAYPSLAEVPLDSVDLISVYVPPESGLELLEEMIRFRPEEVWLNPGSESRELLKKAEELGLPVIQACSILGIGRTPGEF